MNIILFGPPGIGKSTLIARLKSEGYRAIDLEDVYPSKIRFQLPSLVDSVIFGAADLNPARKYRTAKKILLRIGNQKAYEERRATRDASQPGKKLQKKQYEDDWVSNSHKLMIYDMVVDASGTIDDTLNKLKEVIMPYVKQN